jgi:hypothetical protein
MQFLPMLSAGKLPSAITNLSECPISQRTFKSLGEIIFGMFLSMGVAALGAVFVDRWHPVRVNFYAKIFALLTPLIGLKWLFFSPSPANFYWVFLVDEIILLTVNYVNGISAMPKLMRTLPKSRFGQFCSAGAMFRSILVLIMGLVLGALIDLGRKMLGGGEFIYRFIWVWRTLWAVLGTVSLYLMYREWKKLGGTTSYRAPAPWSEAKYEVLENSEVVEAAAKPVKIGVLMWDITVLIYLAGAAFFVWFFRGVSGGIMDFIVWTVPGAVILAVLYGRLRMKIMNPVKRGDMPKVPHHGLLILTAAQQLLIVGAALFQSLLCGREAVKLSAQMYCFELIIGICAVLLLWFSVNVELKSYPRKDAE